MNKNSFYFQQTSYVNYLVCKVWNVNFSNCKILQKSVQQQQSAEKGTKSIK